jgi:hypothetical protein
MKRTRDVKPKQGAVARALEDALAPLKWPPTAAQTVPQDQTASSRTRREARAR